MQYLFIIGIFEALFLFAFIMSKKNRSKADSVLAIAFLLFGLNILSAFLEWQNRLGAYLYPSLIQSTPPLILLHGPVLWFYIKYQTEQNFKFKAIHLLHFLPFAISILVFSLSIYSLPVAQKISLDSSEGFKKLSTFGPMMMSILILPLVYYAWGLALLNSYQKRIKNYFSEIAQVDLQWLRVLLISSLVLAGVINSTFFVDQFVRVAPFGVLQAASYVFVSVYVLFLGFFGHKQEALITKVPLQMVAVESVTEYETPIIDADELFIYRLLEWMKQEKPYLAPELTISALSEQLQVGEEYLSGILNAKLHRNFFDFVNQYRVDEFKMLCSNPENDKLTLIALAFDSGFNSKATFNRVFKNATGLTPSAYKQSVSEK